MKKIGNFGSLNIDYVYSVDSFVTAGETISSKELSVFCGGKGLNQSIAASRAGSLVLHCGNVGKTDGFMLSDILQKNGINTKYVLQKNCASGHAIIQVDKSGQNCIIIYGGANVTFENEQIDSALNELQKGDFVLLQNETNNGAYIINQAKKRELTVVLNPSPINENIRSLPLEKVDMFVLNEHEAAAITGESNVKYAEKKMTELFPNSVIVLTLGSKGAVYISNKERFFCAALKVKAVDTTAAGDTFTGYLLSELALGKTPENAMKTATKAAALCITKHGAEPSIPAKNEVEQFKP